jgi:hypothetical protein
MEIALAQAPPVDVERRRTRRHTAVQSHGVVGARVRPGHDAELIDVSRGGVLIETTCRLLPGAPVDLQLSTLDARAIVRGRVLRCSVAQLCADRIRYRGAIVFSTALPWFAHEADGYPLPVPERRAPLDGHGSGAPETS